MEPESKDPIKYVLELQENIERMTSSRFINNYDRKYKQYFIQASIEMDFPISIDDVAYVPAYMTFFYDRYDDNQKEIYLDKIAVWAQNVPSYKKENGEVDNNVFATWYPKLDKFMKRFDNLSGYTIEMTKNLFNKKDNPNDYL